MQSSNTPLSNRRSKPRTLGLVLLLVSILLPASAFAQRTGGGGGGGGGGGATPAFLDANAQLEIISEGDGWKLLRDTNVARRPVPDAELVAVWPHGVEGAPISEGLKDVLRDKFGLKPGLAITARSSKSTHMIMADKTLYEAWENGESLDPWSEYVEPGSHQKLLDFGWETKTRTFDWGFDEYTENRTFNLGGGLTGFLGLDIPFQGHANLVLTYEQFEVACIPTLFEFKQARVYGNIDILGSSDLNATAGISGQWQQEWEVMNPKIGETNFTVGPIYVSLEYRLPLYIGYELAAQLQGSLTVDSDLGVSGTFDYTCTRDDCTGSSNFSDPFETFEDQVTGSIELDINAKLFARLMFRVALYDENFLFVEAGAKGYVEGDLWGYYGNNCGDGDGDGQNEVVEALVVDANAGFDWVYGYGGALGDRLWTSSGPRWWLGYWDLLGDGGSTAMSAMISGPSEVIVGEPATYQVRLRPCYKYSEPVLFGMAPGDWTGELINIQKGETKTVSRTFSSVQAYDIRARLAGDTKGRPIRVNQFKRIQVVEPEPDAALVLSYLPASGGARREFRSEEPGQQPTQEFRYDAIQGNFENRPGGACANGTNNPTYVYIGYDGPQINGCRFQTHIDSAPIECWQNLVDTFNSNELFVLNTDTIQVLPSTCQVGTQRVCGPGDYCWVWVEFDLADGTQFTRSVAYRKNY